MVHSLMNLKVLPYKISKQSCFESESGHIVEYDDTDGETRLHEYHKSGTFR